MDGQMSIFDFPEYLPDQKAEFVMDNSNCRGCEFFLQGYYKVDERTGATWHYDCPGTVSENYPKGTPVNITLMLQDQESLDCFVNPKPICKFSNHSCNKEELWNVAVSLDNNFCPHVCCRMCSNKQCGARCNGAEIKDAGQKIDQEDCFKQYIGKCEYCDWGKDESTCHWFVGNKGSYKSCDEKHSKWKPSSFKIPRLCGNCKYSNNFHYELKPEYWEDAKKNNGYSQKGADDPVEDNATYCTRREDHDDAGGVNRKSPYAEFTERGFGVGYWHRQKEWDTCDAWELDREFHRGLEGT